MKIVHVISGLEIGGAEVFLEQLISFWPNKNDEHVVIAFKGGVIADHLRAKHILVYEVGSKKSWPHVFMAQCAWRTWRLLKELKPDVVLSSLWSANILARTFCFALDIPLISVLHNNASFLNPVKRFLDVFTALCFPHIRVAVACGVAQSYEYYPLFGDFTLSPTFVIENGVDVDGLCARVALYKPERSNAFVFGVVGRLIPEKRILFLVLAFNRAIQELRSHGVWEADLPRLCVVGDGPDFHAVMERVVFLKLQDLVMLPGVQKNMASWYACFSAYVSVSQSEGLSLALLEALAVGLPVIVSAQSGASHFIPSAEDGIAVDGTDEAVFAAAFIKMFTNQEKYAARAEQRTEFIREKYSIVHTAQQYSRLIESVVSKD